MTAAQYRNLIGVLEVFNGERFYSAPAAGTTPTAGFATGPSTTSTARAAPPSSPPGYTITPPAAQLALLQQSYEALKQSVYGALVLQTRLKPYLDAIELTIDERGIRFDTAALAAKLDAYRSANEREALIDLVELNRYALPTLQAVGFDGLGTLRGWIEACPPTRRCAPTWLRSKSCTALPRPASARATSTWATPAATASAARRGDDIAGRQCRQRQPERRRRRDTLLGQDGADTLNGGDGRTTLVGRHLCETGNNVYLFGRGDGRDVIRCYDATAGKLNVLQFKDGVAPGDIVARQVYDSYWGGLALELSIAGTTDKVTVSGFFYGDTTASGYNPVQQVKFADGTTWDRGGDHGQAVRRHRRRGQHPRHDGRRHAHRRPGRRHPERGIRR